MTDDGNGEMNRTEIKWKIETMLIAMRREIEKVNVHECGGNKGKNKKENKMRKTKENK